MKANKDNLIRIAVFAFLAVAIFVGVAGLRGLFSRPENGEARPTEEVYTILSDALLVPGVIFAGCGALGWARTKGVYDGLGYGFRVGLRSTFGRLVPGDAKKHISYYDYKQEKAENRGPWNPSALIVGGVFLLLSLVFTILYTVTAQ